MMPRGLIRSTAYYNNLQAWEDWRKLSHYAGSLGLSEFIKTIEPEPGSGWRKVDKAIGKLRAEIEKIKPTE